MPDDALRASVSSYAVAPGLLFRQWGELNAVVFNPAMNSTHLVDGLAASLLALLLGMEHRQGDPLPAPPSADQLNATVAALFQAGMIRTSVN